MSFAFLFSLFCRRISRIPVGLLGIGGGIIMFPLLLYVPPLLGFEGIAVKSITGLTMIQGFFASCTAMLFIISIILSINPLCLRSAYLYLYRLLQEHLSQRQCLTSPLLFVFRRIGSGCINYDVYPEKLFKR